MLEDWYERSAGQDATVVLIGADLDLLDSVYSLRQPYVGLVIFHRGGDF
jgi:hypothetical protein